MGIGSPERKSSGHIKLKELAERQYEMQLDLNQLRFQDTVALQAMLHALFPTLRDVELKEGVVDISARAYFDQKKLAKLAFDHISLSHLKAHYLPWNSVLTTEHLSGHGEFEFAPELIDDKAELALNIANTKMSSLEGLWVIDDIQSNLNISQGTIIDSHAKGRYGEMQVSLDCIASSGEIIKIALNGKMQGIFQQIPDPILRQKLFDSFAEEQLVATADLKFLEKGEEIIGLAKIINPEGEEKILAFGFEISKKGSGSQEYLETLRPCLPPAAISMMNLCPNERSSENYGLHDGWFFADGLPLEKYLMPFLFEEKTIQLNGIGNFQGKFDQQALLVTYEALQVKLDSPAFAIEAAEIRQNQTKPVHYVDFSRGMHFGFIPLANASYLEKNSDLLFSDINADLILEGKNIHVPSIETFCHGIYMAGALDVASSPNAASSGCLSVDIRMQTLHGKLSQVQNFFSHIQKPLFFLKIPMEGEVSMHQDAGHLQFVFAPDKYDMQIHLKGALADGTIKTDYSDVALHELSLNFEYDYQANVLDFSEIQGTLLVGEPERVEEYTVVGEKICFSDYLHNRSTFDLWVGDKKRDMIRLAGETFSHHDGSDDVQFALDQNLSHFGNVHPSTFHLILKDWWQIQEFRLIADFKLSTLFKDLQRFSRTGFLFLSRHALKKMNDIKKAEGSFKIDIAYDGSLSQLEYHAQGEEIVVDDYSFKKASLDGKKSDDMWIIDQLVVDDASIAADILRKPGSWFINFMGLQLGKSVLMGLQGEYFDDSHTVDGKINLLEVDFAALKEWPKALAFLQKYPIQGLLKASGQFHWEGNDEEGDSKFDALLNASVKNLQFQNLNFDDIQQASLHYASDRGIIARQVNTALAFGGSKKADLKLEKFEYDLRQDAFSLENLKFLISFTNVATVLDQVSQNFPSLFAPSITSMLDHAKQYGDLEGSLNFDYADPHYGIKLMLKDGEYNLLNKKLYLSNFVLEYDPCEVNIMAKCIGQAFPFWLQYKSSCSQGVLLITEDSPANLTENPLIVKCQYDEHGFSIDEAAGQLHGMTFNLVKDSAKEPVSQAHFLEGKIKFNAKDAVALMSQDLSEKFGIWQIGAGYCLKGQWELYPAQMANEFLKSYFEGQLLGQNFEFKGYQFENLIADMKLTPKQVLMTNIHVTDPCGNLHITDLRFLKQRNDVWKLILSKAEAQEFKPSLLQKSGLQQTDNQKTLVFRELSLEGLQGTLGYPESFIGTGSLVFVNPPKKNTSHPLFAIPGEILAHLGLDLSVLNPVIGTITYEVKEAKIFLTKLKDAYSQGKMSKFYLPNNSFKSSVDFDGNLNVQIKMKHYNLFFKLAELFTVTIQGTLQKPTYTLQKQKNKNDKN